MSFNKSQRAWLLYDPALSAYAMIVRTLAAPLFLAYLADGFLSEAKCTEYWGYTCSIAGLTAGAVSVFFGPKIDAGHKKVQTVAIFTALGVLSTLAYVLVPHLGIPQWAPLLVMLVSFTGMISFMGANSFYDSLLISVADESERDKVSSWGFALGYAGALISFLCCWPWMQIAEGRYFFQASFIIAALWWLAGAMPMFFRVRESAAEQQIPAVRLADTLKFIISQKNILIFLIAYFLYIDGVGTIMMQAALIAKSLGISGENIMLTILALQVIGLPFTLLFGYLAKRFSGKVLVLTAIVIYILISGIVTVMSFSQTPRLKIMLFYTAAALIGTAQGGIQSLSRSLFSRIIPAERSAELFAVYNIFGRFTTIVGPLVMIPLAVHLWEKAELGVSLMILPFICGALLLAKVKVPGN